jgi:uncharacterized protein (DUF952 family)
MSQTIYKILDAAEWAEAETRGRYEGSEVDRQDGFIHFSTAAQVEETARRHFAGRSNLVLVAVDAKALDGLKWETSRGGDLFPHLYGPLPISAACWAKPIHRDGERHVLPDLNH